jgi:hypothetical protein
MAPEFQMSSTSYRQIARATAVVLIIGATALTTAPVQAQGLSFGFRADRSMPAHRMCLLNDRQLRRAIAREGYEDIFLNVANNNRIQVRASRGRWVYLLRVNSCTGRILDSERLRRR